MRIPPHAASLLATALEPDAGRTPSKTAGRRRSRISVLSRVRGISADGGDVGASIPRGVNPDAPRP